MKRSWMWPLAQPNSVVHIRGHADDWVPGMQRRDHEIRRSRALVRPQGVMSNNGVEFPIRSRQTLRLSLLAQRRAAEIFVFYSVK